jgi:hypothetical protein
VHTPLLVLLGENDPQHCLLALCTCMCTNLEHVVFVLLVLKHMERPGI